MEDPHLNGPMQLTQSADEGSGYDGNGGEGVCGLCDRLAAAEEERGRLDIE